MTDTAESISDRRVGRRLRVTFGSRVRDARIWCAVAAVAVATFLFSRIGIDAHLRRDDAIYAYGGQQVAHGVPPYVSIFDPKGPLPAFILGIATWFAHVIGVADLTMMRLVFFAICVLTALAVYLLVLQIWRSVLGALTAAVVFASFQGYAQDALRGPDAHAIGPLWAVLSMWFALRRQWYWAAFMASMASLVKQTYITYTVVVIIAALLYSSGRRRRALVQSIGGALTPLLLTFLYFAAKGAVGKAWESAVVFPAVGLHRAKSQTIVGNVKNIVSTMWHQYDFSSILFWVGSILLVGIGVAAVVRAGADWRSAALNPAMVIVGLTLLAQSVYLLRDFLSYDDVYQLLPYAAAGFGGTVALAVRRCEHRASLRLLEVATSVALAALIVLSSVWFVRARFNDHELPRQRAAACAVNDIVPARTRLYAIGDPVPLVLTRRTNPDRYIYLFSGVAIWKLTHTRGGMRGWIHQVTNPRNSVVVFQGWYGKHAVALRRGIRRAGYRVGYLGMWHVYLDKQARSRAALLGVHVTARPTPWPLTTAGAPFRSQGCRS
jgi:hypothetical protein